LHNKRSQKSATFNGNIASKKEKHEKKPAIPRNQARHEQRSDEKVSGKRGKEENIKKLHPYWGEGEGHPRSLALFWKIARTVKDGVFFLQTKRRRKW